MLLPPFSSYNGEQVLDHIANQWFLYWICCNWFSRRVVRGQFLRLFCLVCWVLYDMIWYFNMIFSNHYCYCLQQLELCQNIFQYFKYLFIFIINDIIKDEYSPCLWLWVLPIKLYHVKVLTNSDGGDSNLVFLLHAQKFLFCNCNKVFSKLYTPKITMRNKSSA